MQRIAALIGMAALTAALAGCGQGESSPSAKDTGTTTEATTKEAGRLLVGADIPYVPFAFGDPPKYEGMDMDLVHEVGARLGLTVTIQKTPFDTIFRDVAQGRFDMVAASVLITEERRKKVAFSVPYFNADQSVMVKKGSGITGVADLAGKRLGAVLAGTGEKWAKANVRTDTIRTYDMVDDAFKALAAGQIDAVINDFPSSKFAVRTYDQLEVVETIATGEQYGFVFKTGSPLRGKVDEALLAMKRDGAYDRVYRKWFEDAPPANLLAGNG
ncbi:amino acid ABC transporter substrate-binding protein [Sphaerisporangium rufum]|uniref:Amino acid ABC transporter substrate-binding protein n=1 Tax=Sphaerisporangium rufum TaxID=1381558 RepID=A0A919UWY1_9ACTN|nr:transporter substrate-binding domain-containing protein [Sphaerisporangium rufum]GII76466.1 amino acid ABC transporter substrate-binding protein [Sphaerisporangium rufum]